MSNNFEYIFPSIKGLQAGRNYYISMCPLGLIPKIFIFDDEDLGAEVRAQRVLNKNRIPDMARYILDNENDYVFSALTASIDATIRFSSLDENGTLGSLHVPMTAKFIINDGQHRRAAIDMALHEKPELASETIAIVFFLDPGLLRCQQMFADLNQFAVRPSKSLNVLYDKRNYLSKITRQLVFSLSFFQELVDLDKTNLSLRSRKLFTLSSIYTANKSLLKNIISDSKIDHIQIASDFWSEVNKVIPDWEKVKSRELMASQVRQDFLHTHGITLQALGIVGSQLIKTDLNFSNKLIALKKINWSKSNTIVWEGRALVAGRVSKSYQHVQATAIYLKKMLHLSITKEEKELEKQLKLNQ